MSVFSFIPFLGTQLSAICSDQTGIESLKYERFSQDDAEAGISDQNPANSSWKNLQAVFGGGGPFSMSWLNPFTVTFLSEKSFEFSV